MIAKTERGFDFLGYHFSPEGLAVQNTLNNFVERAIRLYEQGADANRLRQYVKRWTRWLWGGLDGMYPAKGVSNVIGFMS